MKQFDVEESNLRCRLSKPDVDGERKMYRWEGTVVMLFLHAMCTFRQYGNNGRKREYSTSEEEMMGSTWNILDTEKQSHCPLTMRITDNNFASKNVFIPNKWSVVH